MNGVGVSAAPLHQKCGGHDPRVWVCFDVHSHVARIDFKRTEFIQHHKRGNEIVLPTAKGPEHRNVLDHGALGI